MNLLQLARGRRPVVESRYSLEEYVHDVAAFYYQGLAYNGVNETYAKNGSEMPSGGFVEMVQGAYKRNGIVFACQLARMNPFSGVRFMFQHMNDRKPGDLFGTDELDVLDNPWPNAGTGELLSRMIQDADLAGNAFVRRTGPLADPRLERLRPDWTTIVLGTHRDLLTAEVIGYGYWPGGVQSGEDPIFLARAEVAHWSPLPDPLATYRGMSWMTPVLREIRGDSAATDHKQAFWDNGATPNMVVKMDPTLTVDKFEQFKVMMESEHKGVTNAYKTMFLGGAADVTVVGNNFKDMDLKAIQGSYETRFASAAGVPPIIAGLSEGLAASTYSNYQQARRHFADSTLHNLWRSCAQALTPIIKVPARARLWFDTSGVPMLAEDRKDAAVIQTSKVTNMTALVNAGFEPKSVVAAVNADDLTLLAHSGLVSVQLLPPGPADDPGAAPAAPAPPE